MEVDLNTILPTSIGGNATNNIPKIEMDESTTTNTINNENIHCDNNILSNVNYVSEPEHKIPIENSDMIEPLQSLQCQYTFENNDDNNDTINSNNDRPTDAVSAMINEANRSICEEKFLTGSELKVNGSAMATETMLATAIPIKTPKILSGKPKAFTIENNLSLRGSKSTKSPTGRVRRKREALVATCTYQSQITDGQLGIKLKLKKSATPVKEPGRKRTSSTGTTGHSPTGKGHRKRSRKSKHDSDSDDSDYEGRRRKEGGVNNNTTTEKVKSRRSAKSQSENVDEPVEQSPWGTAIPEHILHRIFDYALSQDGGLPTIVNVGKVCALWQRVSLSPTLWRSLDLSTWVKDRNELILKWIIENRLTSHCVDINLGNLEHSFSSSVYSSILIQMH